MKNLVMMRMRTFGVGMVLLALVTAGCQDEDPRRQAETVIQSTHTRFVPDDRVDRFEVEAAKSGSQVLLTGETTRPDAKQALLDSLRRRGIAFTDSIDTLPAADLGNEVYGLINNSVGNIRSEPGHASQLVTQALLGMPLKVLKRDGSWFLVQTPDDYLGWIDGGGLQRMSRDRYRQWAGASKVIYMQTYGFAYAEPSAEAEKVSDLVAGSILATEGQQGGFYSVRYPDGRSGYVPAADVQAFDEWKAQNEPTQASLVETAKTMVGAPYLWGGTSTKGIDCSGYTKTIFFMNGLVIPRDASQQVRAGTQVDTSKTWDELQVGDLLFFGRPATDERPRRVVHVGMWIGDRQFIHSAGRVHVSSVDTAADNYDAFNVGRYLEARRYLGSPRGNIMQADSLYQVLLQP